jgi:hypothetical protein
LPRQEALAHNTQIRPSATGIPDNRIRRQIGGYRV